MKTRLIYFLYLTLLLILFVIRGYSQTTNTTTSTTTTTRLPATPGNDNIKRPSEPLNIPEIDNYVTACFGLYDQTNQLQTQLNAIEKQVLLGKLSEMDTNNIETELNGFNTQLAALRVTGLELAQSGSAMTDNVYKDLKDKPLKIPGALIRVKNATKAVKVSLQNIHTMLTVTMVNINHRLHPLNAADSAQNKQAPSAPAIVNTGKTMKTSISITGLGFSSFNSLFTEVNTISSIKSTTKKFNSSSTSVIDVVHYGSTDDLLSAILSSCKDVVSDKNVGSSEKGKISLAF
jgi:hypothetical protein